MPFGPGTYDDIATLVRKKTHARAVIVLVIGGDKGEGFSVQADPPMVLALPEILRSMATQIQESLRA